MSRVRKQYCHLDKIETERGGGHYLQNMSTVKTGRPLARENRKSNGGYNPLKSAMNRKQRNGMACNRVTSDETPFQTN